MDNNIKNIILNKKLNKYEKLSHILKYLFVDIANISQNNYFILGSYCIRKYRIINDLDINLDYDEFLKLQNLTEKNIGHIEFYNNQIRWIYDLTNEYNKLNNTDEHDFSIEAFQKKPTDGFPNNNFSLQNLKANNCLDRDQNGHQFFNLKTLLEWKIIMNRKSHILFYLFYHMHLRKCKSTNHPPCCRLLRVRF